jgi:hypothetical protein
LSVHNVLKVGQGHLAALDPQLLLEDRHQDQRIKDHAQTIHVAVTPNVPKKEEERFAAAHQIIEEIHIETVS